MIAADFGFGLVLKNLLMPTQILSVIRLDMIVPVILLLITRKIVDKFGILILYEAVWGLFSVFAMPAAFGLPGLLKLIPAITQGIILDALMSLFQRYHRVRFILAALLGGTLSAVTYYALRIALGMPWSDVVRLLFGIQMATNLLIWGIGAALALVVWERIRNTPAARRLQVVSDN